MLLRRLFKGLHSVTGLSSVTGLNSVTGLIQATIIAGCVFLWAHQTALAGPEANVVAQQVDALINQALAEANVTPAPPTNDEDFLRRVSLDLAGDIPSPAAATLFGLNPDPEKRAKVIDQLLASDQYAKIWASYWTDVIILRATEQRVRIAQFALENWLEAQFAQNRHWDDITHDLLTATGSVSEAGQTGLIFAHTGDPQELTAEVSRIFLGIQMSCANCHDHPTDKWKREQFHQLAAFLPRISVRREDPQQPNSFVVTSVDTQPGRGRMQDFDPVRVFQFMDRNRDGQITKDEARGPLAERFDDALGRADADKNGKLSAKEFENVRPPMDEAGRGSDEYYMPDLNDPSSRGTLTQPVFLLSEVKGPKLAQGAGDLERRNALSDYITAKSNPWFAKAFVNRVWGELLGEGFYMPIDDIGPERSAQMDEVLTYLARMFSNNNYDVKWLYRTIALTDAYQRQIRSIDPTQETPAFASAAPTRLRSDQIFHALQEVLGVTGQTTVAGRRMNGDPQLAMAVRAGLDPTRLAFGQLFGFDPSTPQEDLLGNVPQALFMMNSPQLNTALNARGNTRLGLVLQKYSNDDDALNELYLLALTRNPTIAESEINNKYIRSMENRHEAFEDILWSLLNSTEFLSKR